MAVDDMFQTLEETDVRERGLLLKGLLLSLFLNNGVIKAPFPVIWRLSLFIQSLEDESKCWSIEDAISFRNLAEI